MSRLHEIEGGVLRAPFWRRMCAWMQAGLISRLLDGCRIDPERIQKEVIEHGSLEDIYIQFLDLRREPMLAAGEISALALRREVLDRLLKMRERHHGDGRALPNEEEIERAHGELRKAAPLAWPCLPGPLDGANRPEEEG